MIANRVTHAAAGFALLIFIAYVVHAVDQKPRVLILHSYHEQYSWVQGVNKGIERVLRSKPYSLRWHYMDTKRHSDVRFQRRAARSALDAIAKWQPHVVLSVADNAQQLVTATPELSSSESRIVFAGVLGEPADYGYDRRREQVTGILERWPMDVIQQGIEELFLSDAKRADDDCPPVEERFRVRHIGDASISGEKVHSAVEAFEWSCRLSVSSTTVASFADWKAEVELANSDVDLVVFSLYHTLSSESSPEGDDQVSMAPREVMRWTKEHLDKPSLGGWGFFVNEHRGMLSIGVSAVEQGEVAAQMVVDILDHHKPLEEIAVQRSEQFLIHLCRTELDRHGLQVPSVYEAFARATGNYFEDCELAPMRE